MSSLNNKFVLFVLTGTLVLSLVGCSTPKNMVESPPNPDQYGGIYDDMGGVPASGSASVEVASFSTMLEHATYRADSKGRVHGYGDVGSVGKDLLEDAKRGMEQFEDTIK